MCSNKEGAERRSGTVLGSFPSILLFLHGDDNSATIYFLKQLFSWHGLGSLGSLLWGPSSYIPPGKQIPQETHQSGVFCFMDLVLNLALSSTPSGDISGIHGFTLQIPFTFVASIVSVRLSQQPVS